MVLITFSGPETLKPGQPMPPFRDLPGVDDKKYSSESFAGAPVLVVVFTCNHCPSSRARQRVHRKRRRLHRHQPEQHGGLPRR